MFVWRHHHVKEKAVLQLTVCGDSVTESLERRPSGRLHPQSLRVIESETAINMFELHHDDAPVVPIQYASLVS